MVEYKSIKVTDEEYKMIEQARRELANRGLNALDNTKIPKNSRPSNLETFAIGAIVGLGIAALLALLAESD